MADFFQSGALATLHRLGPPRVPELEAELTTFARERPIALVLPCHLRDLGGRGLAAIVRELAHVPYLQQIVVGVDGATRRADWLKARAFFRKLPQPTTLLWNDGPRLRRLLKKLDAHDFSAGPTGKGRNVWLCLGVVLAGEQARVVAVHDCDILTYSRELLARLCHPVAHPSLGFDFCKGYYARVTDRLNGRVMRLLITPLLRALRGLVGAHPFLVFLETFRYPLAGEICLEADLARRLRIPCDWALEVGVLAEVFRNAAPRAICQSELCDNYDHKHQELSPRDASHGLHRMAIDIARSLFHRLAAEGIRLDAALLDTLLSTYLRQADDALRSYAADASINGLEYPRHDEERAVATFAHSLRTAGKAFQKAPAEYPLIPSWNRVESALPHFLEELREAVRLDNA